MKVYNAVYIPHLREADPEVRMERFGWLSADEDKDYKKHCGADLDVEFLNNLLEKHDSDLTDDDIMYYLVQGLDEAEDAYGHLSKDSIHTPSVGDYYRGLMNSDDLTIIVEEVF